MYYYFIKILENLGLLRIAPAALDTIYCLRNTSIPKYTECLVLVPCVRIIAYVALWTLR